MNEEQMEKCIFKKKKEREEKRERQQTMTTHVLAALAIGSVGRRSSAFLTVPRQKDASPLPKSTGQ